MCFAGLERSIALAFIVLAQMIVKYELFISYPSQFCFLITVELDYGRSLSWRSMED